MVAWLFHPLSRHNLPVSLATFAGETTRYFSIGITQFENQLTVYPYLCCIFSTGAGVQELSRSFTRNSMQGCASWLPCNLQLSRFSLRKISQAWKLHSPLEIGCPLYTVSFVL